MVKIETASLISQEDILNIFRNEPIIGMGVF